MEVRAQLSSIQEVYDGTYGNTMDEFIRILGFVLLHPGSQTLGP